MDINELLERAHGNAVDKGFWDMEQRIAEKLHKHRGEIFSLEEIKYIMDAFKAQKIALIMSELGEAVEALRLNDWENFEEEMADVGIRLGDMSEGYGIDLPGAIRKKMETNSSRPKMHGKEF